MNRAVTTPIHQYIDRQSGSVVDETILSDRRIRWLYSSLRESAPRVFHWLTHSPELNQLLAKLNFDKPFARHEGSLAALLDSTQIDFGELAEALPESPSWRDVFGRRIRYWELRPLPANPRAIVAPSDARTLLGRLSLNSRLSIKGKFFDLDELLASRQPWSGIFRGGDWVLFRLTPEQYHYNHCPVSGIVEDFYESGEAYHSCNPTASIEQVTPLSKNRRAITIINTDCEGGSGVGRVAMIEVVALLIGRVRQAYSPEKYLQAQAIRPGMLLQRGAVKSEFMPGSSSVVLLFEANRVVFDDDLVANQLREDVKSRFSFAFSRAMVETEVRVRSQIAVPNY